MLGWKVSELLDLCFQVWVHLFLYSQDLLVFLSLPLVKLLVFAAMIYDFLQLFDCLLQSNHTLGIFLLLSHSFQQIARLSFSFLTFLLPRLYRWLILTYFGLMRLNLALQCLNFLRCWLKFLVKLLKKLRLFIELLSGWNNVFGYFIILFFDIFILFFKVLHLCRQLQKLFQLLVCYLYFFLFLFDLFYL